MSDGSPALFASTNWFVSFLTPTAGTGADASLSVYANGYDQAATGTYDGLEGIAALWVSNSLGTVPGEWTADEAADTILAASDDYKYTVEFRSETSLGANDAARRATVVTALQSSINSNTEVRSPAFEFNLILCPGYHETVDEMVALSVDVEQEAFVIGDTPMNQTPAETVAWAATSARVSSVSVAYYYPHSLASNLDGSNVLAAASGTALRTYAFSDNQSELWFAPAGTRRGLVSGVTQVGYVNSAGTFVETNLNNGQRDDLYKYFTNINPIVFFPGRGIVVWGQKTSSPDASARDRVNVERLIAFVRRQLRKSLLSFVFEPNDALTRDNVKASVDNFLGDLVVRRGLYDYATICDDSNNTPDRIDRNELWVDVALQPVKAAEFIFVPIRIVATGTEI
jgi:phage tail sheath protein FI